MTKMLFPLKSMRCAALALSIFGSARAETNPALWSGLKYRMIGPERGGLPMEALAGCDELRSIRQVAVIP